jgi:uncharacterized protein YkwD
MRTRLTLLCLALLAVAIVPPDSASAQSCANANLRPRSDAELDQAVVAVRCLVTAERRRSGRARLHPRTTLDHASGAYARRMVRERFFAHEAPDGGRVGNRIVAAGYAGWDDSWHVGEALAWGTGKRGTPASTVRAWMQSPPHRRILLGRDYRDVGVGVAAGVPIANPVRPGATYVLVTGVRRR